MNYCKQDNDCSLFLSNTNPRKYIEQFNKYTSKYTRE